MNTHAHTHTHTHVEMKKFRGTFEKYSLTVPITVSVKISRLAYTVMRYERRFSAVLHIFLSAEGCGCLAEGRGRLTS